MFVGHEKTVPRIRPEALEHQFSNSAKEDFAFICIVPEEGDK